MVAEEHADLAAFARPSVRTIEGVDTASPAQGAVKDEKDKGKEDVQKLLKDYEDKVSDLKEKKSKEVMEQ